MLSSIFNRYMNRESHSKGQNIFDIKEFDYESFREAFKLVFEITGYKEHYKKMSKKNREGKLKNVYKLNILF